MKKKVVVISLGGSLIVPKEMDVEFLEKFKSTLKKHYKTHKFVIICGGGTIARKYITALKKQGASPRELAAAGIRATRMNAQFMMQFFGDHTNQTLPTDMQDVKKLLPKNSVVLCGALRYAPKSTSDGTSAKLANFLNTYFINMTDVDGLYSANPKTNPKAKFFPTQTWKVFEKRALGMKFKAAQHFVLDQSAAVIIRQNKIPTYILGKKLNNLDNVLSGKKFKGTLISD